MFGRPRQLCVETAPWCVAPVAAKGGRKDIASSEEEEEQKKEDENTTTNTNNERFASSSSLRRASSRFGSGGSCGRSKSASQYSYCLP